MNVGPSDVVAGIKLAIWIHEHGFADENSASVKYLNFKNDILNFHILLNRLDQSLCDARNKYHSRGRVPGEHSIDPYDEAFERERKQIIGDFLRTLHECEILLSKNQQWKRQKSSVTENLRYNLSLQELRVEQLRERLKFHSQKISLVMDRLQFDVLTDMQAKVDDILAYQEQTLHVVMQIWQDMGRTSTGTPTSADLVALHTVSPRIEQIFLNNIHINAPTDLQSENLNIPLSDGFDALLLYFEHGSDPNSDQTPTKYLQFLKAKWLLDRIKDSTEYKAARAGYYFKRAVNSTEQLIHKYITQPGKLIAYDEDSMLELPETCFQIWQERPQPMEEVEYEEATPMSARANEEKIAIVSLGSNGDTVTVFRKSAELLRVVLKKTSLRNAGETILESQNVHVCDDAMVPRYALPTLINPCRELALYSRGEEINYAFRRDEDLFKFQTALLGYEVSHNEMDVWFECSAKQFDCRGRAQLWQDPISAPPALGESKVPRSSSLHSPRSKSAGSHSRHDSLASSLAPSTTVRAVHGGWEADNIKLPAFTIFTQMKEKGRSRFVVLSIELQALVYIDPSACPCHRDPNCTRLVMRHRQGLPLLIRYLQSETDRDGKPNPNSFDVFPLRTPRHSKHNEKLLTREISYIQLSFKTVETREKFAQELQDRFEVRDAQLEQQQNFTNHMVHRANKPQRQSGTNSLTPSPHLPPDSRLSVRSLPAQLGNRPNSTAMSPGNTIPEDTGDKFQPNYNSTSHTSVGRSPSTTSSLQYQITRTQTNPRANSSATVRLSTTREPALGLGIQDEIPHHPPPKKSFLKSLKKGLKEM